MLRTAMKKEDRRELLLVTFFSLAVIAALATGALWFFARSTAILENNLQEYLKTSALLAAMQFKASEVEAIQDKGDMGSNLFRALVSRAERIRTGIPDVEYLYVMRRTEDPHALAFVIENDMLRAPSQRDRNGNGILDPEEEISLPGDRFDVTDVPAMQDAAFKGPAVDPAITHDEWGWWMSAYAPIRDAHGNAVAILGVDMRADRFLAATERIFSPVALAHALFGFILIGSSITVVLWWRRIRLLQRMDERRRTLVTVASHKLGGPIATLRWWTEILREGLHEERQQQNIKEAEQQLTESIDRLSDVMQNLQEATRTEATEEELRRELARETAQL